MGRLWRRKSVDEGVTERRAGFGVHLSEAASGAGAVTGALKIQNKGIKPKTVYNSSGFGNSDKHLDQSYGGHSTGLSIKQLLADEMSNEWEKKRRSPSIIARLMGYEGLSVQQPTHKQLPNYQAESQHINNENYESTRTSTQQQQFKDVYEVSESARDEIQINQSRRFTKLELSEAETAFIQQKFIDKKRYATDKNCQGSKAFFNALEVLELKKDLCLKQLREPDTMFANHLHYLRRPSPHSQCSHSVLEEPSANQRLANKDRGTQYRRQYVRNDYVSTAKKDFNDTLFYRTSRHDCSSGNSKNCLSGSDDRSTYPSKIVVLKPNFQRIQVSEPDSEILSCVSEFNTRPHKAEQHGKKHLVDDLQLLRHNAGESRELAKRITKKMKLKIRTGSPDFTLHDYSGDESSFYESENDYFSGSDSISSRKYCTIQYKVPLSHFSGSSLNKDAKERLSERWKMTRKFQEVGISKSRTLGEMLSVPESTKESKIVILAGKGTTNDHRFSCSEGQALPLGISSGDGWKYGRSKSLPRAVSVPASSASPGTPVSTMRRKLSDEDVHLMRKMSLKDPNKAEKEYPQYKEGLKDRRSRRSKRLHSPNIGEKNNFITYQPNDYHVCDDIPHRKDIITSETTTLNAGRAIYEVQCKHQDILETPRMPLQEYHLSESTCRSKVMSPNHGLGIFNKQNEGYTIPAGSESTTTSKDIERTCPTSDLSIPFPEDLSSGTECFGSLTADLKGLRLQLQLLKKESKSYAEGRLAISSSDDDDDNEESTRSSEKRSLVAVDGLDSSYIVDALTNSRFYDADPCIFMAKWHSPDCPLSPAEFEKLEEKHDQQAIGSRSERKILFDLINSGLIEIFSQFCNPLPWVKNSLCPTIAVKKNDTYRLEEKLLNWLQIQITQENDDPKPEKVISKELKWYEPSLYVDQVGTEIEGLLTYELITEIVECW